MKSLLELKYGKELKGDYDDLDSDDLEQMLKREKLKLKQFDANKLLEQDMNDTLIEKMKRQSSIEVSADDSDELVDLVMKNQKEKIRKQMGFEPRSLTAEKQKPKEEVAKSETFKREKRKAEPF